MILPVYILIRTSRRPGFFQRMMESIKEQSYKNIVTIVHSDDPRDEYVTGDIVIKGNAFGNDVGSGPYNLYCNRLLSQIPKYPGWIHFLDDDDEYFSPDALEKFVDNSKTDHINVCRVSRTNGKIYPKEWENQKSFQTECFLIHTDYRNSAKWWGNLGGDHNYSKQLTKILPTNWIEDLIVCKAQDGKGYGKKFDIDKQYDNGLNNFDPEKKVCVLGLTSHRIGNSDNWIEQGKFRHMKFSDAINNEKIGRVKITFRDVQVINNLQGVANV